MTLTADLYFSFRSPYSYLSAGRYRQLSETHTVDITLRPVYPIAIRDPDILFGKNSNPQAPRYIMMDSFRAAQFHGIPFRWPRPDPVVQDPETRAVAADQPYIHRMTRLAQAATRRGKGLEFADEASRVIWSGEVDNWHEGDHLAGAAERAGLDFAELEAEVQNDEAALEAEISSNQDAMESAGHWGVPTLVFNNEPFFGQDRIDMAKWRMEQQGLKKR